MLELLSLGANVLGGVMGATGQSRARKEARRQFDQQMNESVQRRVLDARKAGVHPLFALGASVGASPTFQAGGESDPRQKALTSMAEALGVISQNRASAKRDEAEAALMDSERRRIEQDLNSRGSDLEATDKVIEPIIQRSPALKDALYEQPVLPTTKPGQRAIETGVRSPYVEYRRADGSKGLAFGPSIPGAEEINTVWIPLQNWWHTSKEARRKIREGLGITDRMVIRPEDFPPELLKKKIQTGKAKELVKELNKVFRGPPIR